MHTGPLKTRSMNASGLFEDSCLICGNTKQFVMYDEVCLDLDAPIHRWYLTCEDCLSADNIPLTRLRSMPPYYRDFVYSKTREELDEGIVVPIPVGLNRIEQLVKIDPIISAVWHMYKDQLAQTPSYKPTVREQMLTEMVVHLSSARTHLATQLENLLKESSRPIAVLVDADGRCEHGMFHTGACPKCRVDGEIDREIEELGELEVTLHHINK